MTICHTKSSFLETPIGLLKVSCCLQGVHSIEINSAEAKPNHNVYNWNNCKDEKTPISDVVFWLKTYFKIPVKCNENFPPICPVILSSKGKFTENVWKTLLTNVPIGKTISYGGLAELCGNALASRAVGTAMKNNPIPLLIPCHRVVKSDGSIGHYSGGGRDVKKWLLEHENMSTKFD